MINHYRRTSSRKPRRSSFDYDDDQLRNIFLEVWDVLTDIADDPNGGYDRQVGMTGYYVAGNYLEARKIEGHVKDALRFSEFANADIAKNVKVVRSGEDNLGFPRYFVGIVQGDVEVSF